MNLNEIIASATSALLQDADTKQAVLAYLKAKTDEIKPPAHQHMIWEALSPEVRRMVNPYTGATEDHVLYLTAVYDKQMRLGIVSAYPITWRSELPDDNVWSWNYPVNPNDVYRKVVEGHYTDVIRFAQTAMTDAVGAWDTWLVKQGIA